MLDFSEKARILSLMLFQGLTRVWSRSATIAFAVAIPILLALGLLPAMSQTGDAKAGKVVYERNCASCHGRNGKGLGVASPTPDFTNRAVMSSRSDERLYDKIANGGKGTGMPAWRSRLSEQERRNVIAYIRTFAR